MDSTGKRWVRNVRLSRVDSEEPPTQNVQNQTIAEPTMQELLIEMKVKSRYLKST